MSSLLEMYFDKVLPCNTILFFVFIFVFPCKVHNERVMQVEGEREGGRSELLISDVVFLFI